MASVHTSLSLRVKPDAEFWPGLQEAQADRVSASGRPPLWLLDGPARARALAIRVRKLLPSFAFTENQSHVSLSDPVLQVLRLAELRDAALGPV